MNTKPYLAISNRLRSTPFTSRVMQQGAKGFTVYNHMLLPIEFESLEADYWHLCEFVQVWDVGVERQVSIHGPDAEKLVQWMTPRNISKVDIGQCVYAPLVDEHGFMINDPVALKLNDEHWWLSIADSDVLLWAKGLATAANLEVGVSEPDVWPLAVQGPQSELLMCDVFGEAVKDIRFFRFTHLDHEGHSFLVARSGWSKQGGFEIYVDDAEAGVRLYDSLFESGKTYNVKPGCPNLIERVESGLISYGNDMIMSHTLLETGLDRFVNIDDDIDSLSLSAIRKERTKPAERRLLGLALPAAEGATPLMRDYKGSVLSSDGEVVGRLGSEVWSPRYQQQLVTVMLEQSYLNQAVLDVQLQSGQVASATVLELPFDFAAAGIEAVSHT